MNYKNIQGLIESNWYVCKEWLSKLEIYNLEKEMNIVFPIEYKMMLQKFMPTWDIFIDWRNIDNSWFRFRFTNQFDWILFDVKHNWFRYKSWGESPMDIWDRVSKAAYFLRFVKPLIPIYWHRYVSQIDNWPIFSVVQTDIVLYWTNLESYIINEFSELNPNKSMDFTSITIPFRSDLVSMNRELE